MPRACVRAVGRGCQAGYATIYSGIEDQVIADQEESIQDARFLAEELDGRSQNRLLPGFREFAKPGRNGEACRWNVSLTFCRHASRTLVTPIGRGSRSAVKLSNVSRLNWTVLRCNNNGARWSFGTRSAPIQLCSSL